MLMHARLLELLSYDPDSGIFTWRVDRRSGKSGNCYSARAGDPAGSVMRDGYMRVGIDGKQYALHRLAWLYVTGTWPAHQIDHLDTDRTNQRWLNLRDVTGKVNSQNQRKAQRNNRSTGLLGVTFERNAGKDRPHRARIMIDGKNRTVGMFETAEAAHSAYVEAKRQLHEGCTL